MKLNKTCLIHFLLDNLIENIAKTEHQASRKKTDSSESESNDYSSSTATTTTSMIGRHD